VSLKILSDWWKKIHLSSILPTDITIDSSVIAAIVSVVGVAVIGLVAWLTKTLFRISDRLSAASEQVKNLAEAVDRLYLIVQDLERHQRGGR
jgi:ribosomal protein S13